MRPEPNSETSPTPRARTSGVTSSARITPIVLADARTAALTSSGPPVWTDAPSVTPNATARAVASGAATTTFEYAGPTVGLEPLRRSARSATVIVARVDQNDTTGTSATIEREVALGAGVGVGSGAVVGVGSTDGAAGGSRLPAAAVGAAPPPQPAVPAAISTATATSAAAAAALL